MFIASNIQISFQVYLLMKELKEDLIMKEETKIQLKLELITELDKSIIRIIS